MTSRTCLADVGPGLRADELYEGGSPDIPKNARQMSMSLVLEVFLATDGNYMARLPPAVTVMSRMCV